MNLTWSEVLGIIVIIGIVALIIGYFTQRGTKY